ncbi:MAG: hypothetical protein ACOC44_08330 [Promethearchaeia archaeon]
MIFLTVFWLYLLKLYSGAREKDLKTTRNYFLAMSFFFLSMLINYVQTEINLQSLQQTNQDIYPNILPENFSDLDLFHPIDSDVFLLIIFLLGIVPVVFALEQYILMKKTKYLFTLLGFSGVILITVVILSSLILSVDIMLPLLNFIIPYGYILLIVLSLFVIGIYLRLAFTGIGQLKRNSAFMALGFILQMAALFITSTNAILGHLVSLGGLSLFFIGIINMQ